MNATRPCPTPEDLQRMLDDALGADAEGVESHVAGCQGCQDVLERLTRPATEAGETVWQPPQAEDGPTLGPVADAPPSRPESLPDVPGYVIERVLGRGGMGAVSLARQSNANRQVAVKMLPSGGAKAEDLVRFRLEGENLARLRHPNIVRVYEVGAVGDRPFFSMEYVSGGNLADSLAGTARPPAEAAALAETLARAVHAAHQYGVVHRDLKPANILLDDHDSGSSHAPFKITDFGLAKRVGHDSGLTQTGQILGTPSYMAPEQASGGSAVGIPADVYALGAILFEALTGRPPFRGGSPWETMMKVVHEPPPAPSRFRAGLPRDLEVVCLKCLAKKPEDRYASADALAEDLRRWLDGLPIAARPAGAARRAWLWARRHPAYAALGSLLAASVVAGATGVALQWMRAERHLAQSRRRVGLALDAIKTFYTGASEDVLLKRPELADLRTSLLKAPLGFYQSLREELEADDRPDREARAQLVDVLARVGELNADVGREDDALRAYLEAAETARRILRDEPGDRPARRALGDALVEAAEIDAQTSRLGRARDGLTDALGVFDALARESPDDLEVQEGRAACLHTLGNVECDEQHFEDSERRYLESVAILEDLVSRRPGHAKSLDDLGGAENDLAIMYAQWNRLDRAGRWFHEGLETRRRLAREHGGSAGNLRKFASSLNNYGGFLQNTDRLPDALPYYEEAGAIQERLVRENPTVALYQDDLAVTHENIAANMGDSGRRERAIAEYRAALALRERLAADHPASLDYQARLARSHVELALNLVEGREYASAEAEARAAGAALERAAAHHSEAAEFRRLRAEAARCLGDVHALTGRSGPAEASFAAALDFLKDAGGPGAPAEARLDRARDLLHRGSARAAVGRADAEGDLAESLAGSQALLAEEPEVSRFRIVAAAARAELAEVALRRALREGATGVVSEVSGEFARLAEDASNWLRDEPDDDGFKGLRADALSGLARASESQGRFDDALAAWDRALADAPGRSRLLVELGRAATLCRLGRVEEAAGVARSARGMSPETAAEGVARARVHARASDPVAAVECLARAASAPDRGDGLALRERLADPDFDPIRDRPDFRAVLRSLDVPESPPAAPPAG